MSLRFAPSPTGRFHVGNLRTAWIAGEWARALGIPLVFRFEDIDRARVLAGALEIQTQDLRALGVEAARTELQSENLERHFELFHRGVRRGNVYPCFCSRADVQEALAGASSAPHARVPLYSGRCRTLTTAPETALPSIAWRFRDANDSGGEDFIVARTRPLAAGSPVNELPVNSLATLNFSPAYHWACAIDDFDGRHALLVRAWDLEEAAGPQRKVHALLGEWEGSRPLPAVFHASLVTQEDGHRLEKRTRGVTLPELEARGFGAADLVRRLQKSFRLRVEDFAPARLFGEDKRQLRLSELGL